MTSHLSSSASKIAIVLLGFAVSWISACTATGGDSDCSERASLLYHQISIKPSGTESYERAVEKLRSIVVSCPILDFGPTFSSVTDVSPAEVYIVARMDEELRSELENLRKYSDDQVTWLLVKAAAHRSVDLLAFVVEPVLANRQYLQKGELLFYAAIGSGIDAREKICYLESRGFDPVEKVDRDVNVLVKAVLEDDEESLQTLLSIVSRKHDIEDIDIMIAGALDAAEEINSDLRYVLENHEMYSGSVDCKRLLQQAVKLEPPIESTR